MESQLILFACISPLTFCLVCKEAKADLVFLVDGSWSIGDENFMKITRFLHSTVGSLDLIGTDGTQVSQGATPLRLYLSPYLYFLESFCLYYFMHGDYFSLNCYKNNKITYNNKNFFQ